VKSKPLEMKSPENRRISNYRFLKSSQNALISIPCFLKSPENIRISNLRLLKSPENVLISIPHFLKSLENDRISNRCFLKSSGITGGGSTFSAILPHTLPPALYRGEHPLSSILVLAENP
jgi:hypothetical protein